MNKRHTCKYDKVGKTFPLWTTAVILCIQIKNTRIRRLLQPIWVALPALPKFFSQMHLTDLRKPSENFAYSS